ncbi:MAG TPA: hypothetical protein VGP78_04600, partial [Solirubrobacteraceae bacterium]|nr:hypothetical protein [Solirubrobacteraceae bacterium]
MPSQPSGTPTAARSAAARVRHLDPHARRPRFTRPRPGGRLRVALLAPPWIPIPPPGYGGIELVIAELAG